MTASAARKVQDDARRRRALDQASDAELVARIAGGDLGALGLLYDRHHASVRTFVRRAAGSAEDAEDLTHEAFLTLARRADRYDGRPSARPFLMGIASRLSLERRRSVARLGQVLRAFGSTLSDHQSPSPEGAARASEELRRFEEALARLSMQKRVVILMVDAEGLSGEDVARALEIPVGTVWTRLHYARAELRRALGQDAAGSR